MFFSSMSDSVQNVLVGEWFKSQIRAVAPEMDVGYTRGKLSGFMLLRWEGRNGSVEGDRGYLCDTRHK